MFCDLLESSSFLSEAQDEATWSETLGDLGREQGFEYTLFAILPRPGLPFEDIFVKGNYPCEWREVYDREKYAQVDPTVRHIFSESKPLLWDESLFQSDGERALYRGAYLHGLKSGIVLPIHGPRHEAGMLCLATSDAPGTGVWNGINRRMASLSLLRDTAFESAQPFLGNHLERVIPRLTRREKECLKWMSCGKSTWEMARILNCSEATINFHIVNIRTKLGVHSRSAASLKAARMGLLDQA
jgi:LuxR family quorum-sensing transcriptional regulator LasR